MTPHPVSVSDSTSHPRDQIRNFAELLRGSPRRFAIATFIYKGKKEYKTVEAIATELQKTNKEILTVAAPLATRGLFTQIKVRDSGKLQTAYKKIPFVAASRNEIFALAKDSKKLNEYATKTNPVSTTRVIVSVKAIKVAKFSVITIDDVDQFKGAKSISAEMAKAVNDRLAEAKVKTAINRILGEIHEAKDWGGETADIITTQLKIKGKRYSAAFALKGPAKKGKLVPGKMGKHGDQIQRLFQAHAQCHFVQYEEEIDPSVLYQMQELAKAKAILGQEIFYGVIDDVDTRRLRLAYPSAFA
jgi:hypothetical protein